MLFIEIITNFVPKKQLIVKNGDALPFSFHDRVLWMRWLGFSIWNSRQCFYSCVFVKNSNIIALGVKITTFFVLLNTTHVGFYLLLQRF